MPVIKLVRNVFVDPYSADETVYSTTKKRRLTEDERFLFGGDNVAYFEAEMKDGKYILGNRVAGPETKPTYDYYDG